jgi:hypothetical protein
MSDELMRKLLHELKAGPARGHLQRPSSGWRVNRTLPYPLASRNI